MQCLFLFLLLLPLQRVVGSVGLVRQPTDDRVGEVVEIILLGC
jgi:hypothetical protein